MSNQDTELLLLFVRHSAITELSTDSEMSVVNMGPRNDISRTDIALFGDYFRFVECNSVI